MIPLMKFKDRIIQFVGRYEIYVMAAFRFVVGYVAFHLIITNLPYMEILSEYPFPILLALLCCFLPSGLMVFCAAVLILLELYSLSLLMCLIVGMIFLLMFCLYTRFTYRKGMYAVLTPIMSVLGVPFTMPVASGLLGEPYAVISVICGEFTYFVLKHVTMSEALFMSEDVDSSSVLTLAVSEILMDQEMYLYLAAFAAAAIVTFCICKLSVRQAHLIAAAIGIITQIAIIGGGEIMIGNQTDLMPLLIGCVVSFLILMIITFFTHSLNYKREERVQFEDDDYYYYVTAIPKSFVPRRSKAKKSRSEGRRQERPASQRMSKTRDTKGVEDKYPADDEASAVKDRSRTANVYEDEDSIRKDAASAQLAAAAQEQLAAQAAAERAAAQAVADRAAAAAQAISAAAGLKDEDDDQYSGEE